MDGDGDGTGAGAGISTKAAPPGTGGGETGGNAGMLGGGRLDKFGPPTGTKGPPTEAGSPAGRETKAVEFAGELPTAERPF